MSQKSSIIFGSKAETLERIRQYGGRFSVPPFQFFTVTEWASDAVGVLARIQALGCTKVAVRSSSLQEDLANTSNAGRFLSLLNVDPKDTESLRHAIERVVDSYDGDGDDQILVQEMISDIEVSGVLMTHGLDDGAPYYVINYDDESGRTDAVTGGTQVSKTVFLHRNIGESQIRSERLRAMVRLVRDLEGITGYTPQDIEFGIDRAGVMHLFQARPITTTTRWAPELRDGVERALPLIKMFIQSRSQPRPGLVGQTSIYTTMSDWNPAEIIGVAPRPLAISLYRHAITRHSWAKARTQMGYRSVEDEDLMIEFAGRPYIDVRNSFNSFIPRSLSDSLAETLVNGAIRRLSDYPEYHDKVEFEVIPTCADLSLSRRLEERFGHLLDAADRDTIAEKYRELTREAVRLDASGSLPQAEAKIAQIREAQLKSSIARPNNSPTDLFQARRVLGTRLIEGATAFSILARHGFIAEALLRSCVQIDALSRDRVDHLKRDIRTIARDIAEDYWAVKCGRLTKNEFMARYGHLRPGTYDILSPRYADRGNFFEGEGFPAHQDTPRFTLTDQEKTSLGAALADIGLTDFDGSGLVEYVRRAVAGREYGKYVFTRDLSDGLEYIAGWGEAVGLSREQLSFLPVPDLMELTERSQSHKEISDLADAAKRAESRWGLGKALRLSYLVRTADDIDIAPMHRSLPNFITNQTITGSIIVVDAEDTRDHDLNGAIVAISSADPGFDWILTRGIKGLITKYGGTNSHMAIRCAEFGLPAAIGCGEKLFERCLRAKEIELDCAHHDIRIVG